MAQRPTAEALDDADPLAVYRDRFLLAENVVAYLDGNSLGRPLAASAERVADFIRDQWGGRLIRGWDEGWLDLPLRIGDELGRVCLGAAPGQVTIGDSTTVLLYKLVRAAVAARPGRREILISRADFPTDRYVVEGIAAERGLTVRWMDATSVTADDIAGHAGPDTAVVVLSHVTYRSGYLADLASITDTARDAGALVVWDLSHSVGVVPMSLDAAGVDLAVGCTYKYLNGGPGSPAFAYVRHNLEFRQPIQGWLGSKAPFDMGQGYSPAGGMRSVLSGTPPVLGMLAMQDMIALIDEATIAAVRAKSVALSQFAIDLCDELMPDAVLATPRDAERRGSHITIDHDSFGRLLPRLWEHGVIPDFRKPNGIRLGLSPLSTSFAELKAGVLAIRDALRRGA